MTCFICLNDLPINYIQCRRCTGAACIDCVYNSSAIEIISCAVCRFQSENNEEKWYSIIQNNDSTIFTANCGYNTNDLESYKSHISTCMSCECIDLRPYKNLYLNECARCENLELTILEIRYHLVQQYVRQRLTTSRVTNDTNMTDTPSVPHVITDPYIAIATQRIVRPPTYTISSIVESGIACFTIFSLIYCLVS